MTGSIGSVNSSGSSWYGAELVNKPSETPQGNGLEKLINGAIGVNDTLEIIARVRDLGADDLRNIFPEHAYKSDFELLSIKDKAHQELAQGGLNHLMNTIQGGLETIEDLAVSYITGGNKKLADYLGIDNSTLRILDAVLGAGGSNINSGTVPDSILKD